MGCKNGFAMNNRFEGQTSKDKMQVLEETELSINEEWSLKSGNLLYL